MSPLFPKLSCQFNFVTIPTTNHIALRISLPRSCYVFKACRTECFARSNRWLCRHWLGKVITASPRTSRHAKQTRHRLPNRIKFVLIIISLCVSIFIVALERVSSKCLLPLQDCFGNCKTRMAPHPCLTTPQWSLLASQLTLSQFSWKLSWESISLVGVLLWPRIPLDLVFAPSLLYLMFWILEGMGPWGIWCDSSRKI
jgi:hypothetical protein